MAMAETELILVLAGLAPGWLDPGRYRTGSGLTYLSSKVNSNEILILGRPGIDLSQFQRNSESGEGLIGTAGCYKHIGWCRERSEIGTSAGAIRGQW
ncbi:hypothetical protein L211DRAFT_530010 [Terfezia boudieri ATCC MYA-4762]|uniref:Uncharacterized protein n=1 Tax=Terfezia boudieri ATCC MYA-4762 TaxID=1051890 RepID=A0A3N4LBG3_9PEZI|nr:hypothetical protein L211DRAFT_530010 [Terfezia boudieri ATCC MYA-4762]